MKQYEVSISNTFDAESMEDAVLQMAEWLSEAARTGGYRVTDEDGNTDFIDAEKIY